MIGAVLPLELPTIQSVSLDRYAGVRAALADGIALADVLRQEGILESAWPEVDRGFRELLVASASAHLTYALCLRRAEDCLARSISPLDSDHEAWAGMLGAMALADDPAAICDHLGLTMNDFGRLSRLWRRRAEQDPDVARGLADSAGNAEPPRHVECAPVVLRRFPWTLSQAEVASKSLPPPPKHAFAQRTGGLLPVESDVDLYAAFTVALAMAPERARKATKLLGLGADAQAALASSWTMRFRSNRALEATFEKCVAAHRTVLARLIEGASGVVRARV